MRKRQADGNRQTRKERWPSEGKEGKELILVFFLSHVILCSLGSPPYPHPRLAGEGAQGGSPRLIPGTLGLPFGASHTVH